VKFRSGRGRYSENNTEVERSGMEFVWMALAFSNVDVWANPTHHIVTLSFSNHRDDHIKKVQSTSLMNNIYTILRMPSMYLYFTCIIWFYRISIIIHILITLFPFLHFYWYKYLWLWTFSYS
jgi:hypothetical protein